MGCCQEAAEGVQDVFLATRRQQAVDPTMFLVTQIAFVGIALAGHETLRSGIVLDDEVVPVQNPDSAIGAHFRHNRRRPFVVTRNLRNKI